MVMKFANRGSDILEQEKKLKETTTVKAFKILAQKMLLSIPWYRRMEYPLAILLSCAAHYNDYICQNEGILEFAWKVKKSALMTCPPNMRQTVITRMFRRCNPKFSLPCIPRVKVSKKRICRPEKIWRPILRTNDPSEKAMSIAKKEAERIWQETGDYRKWYDTLISVFENSLFEFCYQG